MDRVELTLRMKEYGHELSQQQLRALHAVETNGSQCPVLSVRPVSLLTLLAFLDAPDTANSISMQNLLLLFLRDVHK